MKKTTLRILCVSLSVIIAFSLLTCIMPFLSSALDSYSAGDIFEFGSYPQSRVTDSGLISSLDGVSKSWVSYSYLTGTGAEGTMAESDYMKYCDIENGGEKYRAVTFTQLRPRQTYKESSEKASFVDDNGYSAGTVYYFKYEPIEWKILDPETGLMVSDKILDSQAYSRFLYVNGTDTYGAACYGDAEYTAKASNYLASSVYEFLNEDFYQTAFSADEQAQIKTSSLVNDSFNQSWQQYASDNSDDKVFLLSYTDIQKTAYGFAQGQTADETRTASGTDYAGIQGLQPDSTGNSPWWLRNAGNTSRNAAFVDYSGFAGTGSVEYTDKGIRPAIECSAILAQSPHTVTFDYDGGSGSETEREVAYGATLGALPAANKVNYAFKGWFTSKTGDTAATAAMIIKADIKLFARWAECSHNFELTDSKDSTCIEPGYKKYVCSVCGAEKTEVVVYSDHTPAPFVIENSTASSCNEAGEYDEVVYCSICSSELSRVHKIKELGSHIPLEPVKEKEKPSTCTEGGNYESVVYCGICGEELSRDYTETEPLGHDIIHHAGIAPTCINYGYAKYDTCSRCDYTTYAELPFTGHTPAEAVTVNKVFPTCAKDGSYENVIYCSVCGEKISSETVKIPALSHKDENNDGICEVCGEIYDKAKYDEYIASKEQAKKEEAAKKVRVNIKTPSETLIKYGHTLVLHPEHSGEIPEGYKLVWSVNGEGFEKEEKDGNLWMKSVKDGETQVTLSLVGPDGKTVTDESGNEIKASVTITSKACFFYKIIWFFKNLFKINMIIDE